MTRKQQQIAWYRRKGVVRKVTRWAFEAVRDDVRAEVLDAMVLGRGTSPDVPRFAGFAANMQQMSEYQ